MAIFESCKAGLSVDQLLKALEEAKVRLLSYFEIPVKLIILFSALTLERIEMNLFHTS